MTEHDTNRVHSNLSLDSNITSQSSIFYLYSFISVEDYLFSESTLAEFFLCLYGYFLLCLYGLLISQLELQNGALYHLTERQILSCNFRSKDELPSRNTRFHQIKEDSLTSNKKNVLLERIPTVLYGQDPKSE